MWREVVMRGKTDRWLLCGFLILTCIPYLISLLDLAFGISGICQVKTGECLATIKILKLTSVYVGIGLLATLWTLRELKLWRAMSWFFWVFSVLVIVYDYSRSPGESLPQVILVKAHTLDILFAKGDALTGLFLAWKDFLNPILLVILGLLLSKKQRRAAY